MENRQKVLNIGYKFNNTENGKLVIRPIQLKDGEYGFFGDSRYNILEPIALTSDNKIQYTTEFMVGDVTVDATKYDYVNQQQYYLNRRYRKKPYGFIPHWFLRLKAMIK